MNEQLTTTKIQIVWRTLISSTLQHCGWPAIFDGPPLNRPPLALTMIFGNEKNLAACTNPCTIARTSLNGSKQGMGAAWACVGTRVPGLFLSRRGPRRWTDGIT